MRRLLPLFYLLLLTCSLEAARPNIVFILSDDHRYDAIGLAGHPFLKTPNLDRLGHEGAWMRQFYVATPLCAPSRAAYLTGMMGPTSGYRGNQGPWPKVMPPTLLSVAHDHGYHVGFYGKKHINNDDTPFPGCDEWGSFVNQGLFRNPPMNVDGKQVQMTGANGDILTDFAVKFIDKNKDKPFCLEVAYKEAHSQQTAPARYDPLFENDNIPLPASFNEDKALKPAFFGNMVIPDSGFDDSIPADQRPSIAGLSREQLAIKKVRNYYRCITALDDYVGRIYKALQDAGVLDNTIIIFGGDNGYFLGDHGRFEKMTPHEESVRVPFLMRFPPIIKKGTVIDAFVMNIDMLPTVCDLTGMKPPEKMDGKSLRPLFRAEDPNHVPGWRQEVYISWQGAEGAVPEDDPSYFSVKKTFDKAAKKNAKAKAKGKTGEQPKAGGGIPTWRAVRTADHKYAVYVNGDLTELYDVKNDPKETTNLAASEANKETVEKLHKRLIELAKEHGDPLTNMIPPEPSLKKPAAK